MTLTQLNAFVLVARLGSVTSAANALGVSESAVSQALTALRQHLGDQHKRVELGEGHSCVLSRFAILREQPHRPLTRAWRPRIAGRFWKSLTD